MTAPTAPDPRRPVPDAQAVAKPAPTWRPMALWSAGILLALGLAWFVGAVAVPAWRTRAVLSDLAASSVWRMRTTSLPLDWSFADKQALAGNAIAALGGPERAIGRLRLYLRLPARLAPQREAAVFTLTLCGQGAAGDLTALARRPETAFYAFCGLSFLGPSAHPALEAALRSPDPQARRLAASALAELAAGSAEALRLLAEALGDGAWAVRVLAATDLSGRLSEAGGERVADLLCEALASANPDAREAAALAVVWSPPRWWSKEQRSRLAALGPALEKLLADGDRRVRLCAAAALWGLERRPEDAAREIIRQALDAETAVQGDLARFPFDGRRMYCQLESDELLTMTAGVVIRDLSRSPAARALPGFEPALAKARLITKSANLRWKMSMPTDEEPPKP